MSTAKYLLCGYRLICSCQDSMQVTWGVVYQHHLEEQLKSSYVSIAGKSFTDCVELASKLSGTFAGAARSKYRLDILKIVKEGISFAFVDAPNKLSFLEAGVLPFISKLAASDALEILKDVQRRAENVNQYENPSGWRPYHTFIEQLHEKYAKNEFMPDEGDGTVRRRGLPRKSRNLEGKKLFHGEASSGEDSISNADQNSQDEEDEDEQQQNQPAFNSVRSSAAKLRTLRISQREAKGLAGTSSAAGHPH